MHHRRYVLPTLLTVLAVMAVVWAPDALAQYGLDRAGGSAGYSTSGSIPSTIGNILKAALGFVGTLFLLLMLYAGFLWMTARGDAKKVDQAKQLIIGAIIGIIVIASAYAITSFVLTAASGTGKTSQTSGTGTGTGGQKKPSGATCVENDECASGFCTGLATGTCGDDHSPCANDTDCNTGVTCTGGGGFTCAS